MPIEERIIKLKIEHMDRLGGSMQTLDIQRRWLKEVAAEVDSFSDLIQGTLENISDEQKQFRQELAILQAEIDEEAKEL